MKTALEQFEKWLKQAEDIDLEFKEAKSRFDDSRGTLFDYCAAISNGKGGKELILNHIKEGKICNIGTLINGFPECKPQDLSNMLQELKKDGRIYFEGSHQHGVWKMRN